MNQPCIRPADLIAIGSKSKQLPTIPEMADKVSQAAFPAMGAMFMGVGALVASGGDPATVAGSLYSAGAIGACMAFSGPAAKFAYLCSGSSEYVKRTVHGAQQVPGLMGKGAFLGREGWALLKTASVSASEIVKGAVRNPWTVAAAALSLSAMGVGSEIVGDLVAAIPANGGGPVEALRFFGQALSYSMAAELPVIGAWISKSKLGDVAEVGGAVAAKLEGDVLKDARKHFIADMASILARGDDRTDRSYALDEARGLRDERMAKGVTTYDDDAFKLLEEAAHTGRIARLDGVTTGLDAWVGGHTRRLADEIASVKASGRSSGPCP